MNTNCKNIIFNKGIFSKLFCFFILSFFVASTYAIEVNRREIESTSNETIVFENYNGPHSKVDTLEQIQSIGSNLAKDFNIEVQSNYGNSDRYYVIHAVDKNETEKLDADIFIIGKDSAVDHVRNLRHIIASYLQTAYKYEYKDAYTLATFVTVYNAVYRSKMNYFTEKYKSVVTKNLNSENVGIALSYKEWAGKTQIVIPLSDLSGGLSSIDTSVISDKKVVESMQEEDDKGIDERKNLVDLKEREAEKAQEKAQDAQKTVTKEEEKLKEEKKVLAEKQKDSNEAQKKADDSAKKADQAEQKAKSEPENKQAQKDAQVAKQKADDDKQKADEAKKDEIAQQEKVDKQEESVNEAKEVAQEQQEKADKKQNEAQKERTEIAKDQKEVIKNDIAEETNSTYALKLVDQKNLYSALVKINKSTGKELKTSPVKVIHNRTVFRDGTEFIAIAGETSKTGAVKLVKLDKDNLEIISESKETIADKSVLVQSGSDFYCIINEKSKYYVGKFNSQLECLAKSFVEVNPATPIFIAQEGIFVTDSSNKVILIDTAKLQLVIK